jgi:hypothetical protein
MILPVLLFIVIGGSRCRDYFARQRARFSRQGLHLDGILTCCYIFEFLKCGIQIAAAYDGGREKNREAHQG